MNAVLTFTTLPSRITFRKVQLSRTSESTPKHAVPHTGPQPSRYTPQHEVPLGSLYLQAQRLISPRRRSSSLPVRIDAIDVHFQVVKDNTLCAKSLYSPERIQNDDLAARANLMTMPGGVFEGDSDRERREEAMPDASANRASNPQLSIASQQVAQIRNQAIAQERRQAEVLPQALGQHKPEAQDQAKMQDQTEAQDELGEAGSNTSTSTSTR